MSRFSVWKFLSDGTNFFHWRTHWCFAKKIFSKIFMRRRGGASRFCWYFLSHRTETKTFVKETFCFPENFCYRKKIMDRRWHITIFSRKFFLSQYGKNSWASLQCFREFGLSKNLFRYRECHVFPSESFCLTEPIFFIGEHIGVSQKISSRKFSSKGGGRASRFHQLFLSHRTETKISVKEPFCFPENYW